MRIFELKIPLAAGDLMKIFTGLLLFLLCFNGKAVADDSAITNIGGTIRPMDEHPSVRLLAEHVHARILKKHALVECIFFLQNEGPESIVEMGFPCYTGEDTGQFEYFESYVDGQKVDIEILEDKQQSPSVWYCKEVRFKEGALKVIRNVYKSGYGGNTMGDIWFTYVLHTGASWRGTIGSVNIVLSFEDFDTDKLFEIEPSGYEMDNEEVRWTLTDFEPEKPWDVVKAMWNGWTTEGISSELHRKAAQGDIEGVRALLEQGLDINSTESELTKTPLCDAIFYGAGPEMVEFLIRNGASVESDPGMGQYFSPLMAALWAYERFGYPFTVQVVELLVDNGAKVHLNQKAINRYTGALQKLLEDYN